MRLRLAIGEESDEWTQCAFLTKEKVFIAKSWNTYYYYDIIRIEIFF